MNNSFLRKFSKQFEKAILGLIGEYAGHGDIKLTFSLTKRRHLGKIHIVDRGTGKRKKLHRGSWGLVYDWDKMRCCVNVKDSLTMAIRTLKSFPAINEYDTNAVMYLENFVTILLKTRKDNCLEDYSLCFLSPYHRYKLLKNWGLNT